MRNDALPKKRLFVRERQQGAAELIVASTE
jgi:hypothetical protein